MRANYWTHFVFFLPGTPAQCAELMAIHRIAYAALLRDGIEAEPARAIRTGADPSGSEIAELAKSLAMEFAWLGEPGIVLTDYETAAGSIWVTSANGHGSTDYAAALAQLHLRRSCTDVTVTFSWSLTCSHPRPDGFGGGAAVITQSRIMRIDSQTFIANAIRDLL